MRKGIAEKINFSNKRGFAFLGILVVLLLAVLFAAHMLGGEEAVRFTVLTDTDIPQEITMQVIPEYRGLERALASKVEDKVYVMVSRGEKPTSGFGVDIDKMVIEDKNGSKNLIVYAIFSDPQPETAISQVLTYPLVIAETSLAELPDRIELRVQY